jgi:hypothetical protein
MTIKTASSAATVVHFALGGLNASVASKGRLIQFDDTLGTGTRATGLLLKQDSSAIATNLSGNYVFNVSGANTTAARYAAAGALTIGGGGIFNNGELDVDNAGVATHATSQTGLLSSTLTANGRGTFTYSPTLTFPTGFAFYLVSSSEALVISTNAVAAMPVVSGELRAQSGTFTAASLNGVSVLHMAGVASGVRSAAIGTLTTDGASTANLSISSQTADTATTTPTATATTFAVAANGRATLAASAVRVIYLTGTNAGFIAADDAAATTGELEAQSGGPFTAASLTGTYFFGTETVGSNAANSEVGIVTPDGSGNATVSLDLNTATLPSLVIDTNSTGAYTVNADGTATVAGETALMVSPSKVVVLDGASGSVTPNVIVLEK